MIRHDLMDLLRPVDIYAHRSEQPVLHVTFPEEFRYLTEPPLPDSQVKLTSDDDMAKNAFNYALPPSIFHAYKTQSRDTSAPEQRPIFIILNKSACTPMRIC